MPECRRVYFILPKELNFKKKIDIVTQGKNGLVAIEIKQSADFSYLASAMAEIVLSIRNKNRFKNKGDFLSRNKLPIKYYIIFGFVNGNIHTHNARCAVMTSYLILVEIIKI